MNEMQFKNAQRTSTSKFIKRKKESELKTGTLFSQENKDQCRTKINEENLHDLLDTIKRNVFPIIGVPKEGEGEGNRKFI